MAIEKIYNIETDETIEVPLTKEKATQIAAYQAKVEAESSAEESKKAAREAIYAKLGLTEEEAAAFLP